MTRMLTPFIARAEAYVCRNAWKLAGGTIAARDDASAIGRC